MDWKRFAIKTVKSGIAGLLAGSFAYIILDAAGSEVKALTVGVFGLVWVSEGIKEKLESVPEAETGKPVGKSPRQ